MVFRTLSSETEMSDSLKVSPQISSRISCEAETEDCPVFLFRIREHIAQLGSLSKTDRKHTGGLGVQGTGVTDLLLFYKLPGALPTTS